MTSGRAALAVLLRTAQWELDKAAFELGGGRYTRDERHHLADQLAELASVLRHDDVVEPAPSAAEPPTAISAPLEGPIAGRSFRRAAE